MSEEDVREPPEEDEEAKDLTIGGVDDPFSESLELLSLGVVLLVQLLPDYAQQILDIIAVVALPLMDLGLELDLLFVPLSLSCWGCWFRGGGEDSDENA